jgi:glycogen(starch) synthase
MRVLMTADSVGGVWTYALELADALVEHGVEVTLATVGPALRPDQDAELGASSIQRSHSHRCALEWMDEPWSDVERAGRWLLRIADEVAPDVVHLNGYAHAALPWGVPVVVVGHSDVLSWHQAVRGTPAGPEWARYGEVVADGLAAADLLIAPTRAMLDELLRLYAPTCPRLVVANGSSRRFQPRSKRAFVVTAGRLWDEAKNVQALVRVAPRVRWPVAVAGEGEVDGAVRPLGRLGRESMDRVLAEAAIFAEPARYEPFGLAALEAGLAGCALVLGDIPSLREVWDDAALFVPSEDEESLEQALRSLIAEPRLREHYATRARRRALGYSSSRMADAYFTAYARLCRPVETQAA